MKEIIKEFYTAFSNLDAEKMVNFYHSDITFNDPAFGTLKGDKAKNMWRMLCQSQKNKDFVVTYNDISVDNNKGFAKWEAIYTFSQTGRKVHNKISAKFEFKNNLIISHTDTFNIYTWAKQAMGFKGLLIGNTSFFKSKLQKKNKCFIG
jgi:ketosteroid isomerase-like protein